MNGAHALTPAIILLAVGILAMVLTRRAGLSPVIGYLAAGLLIGPHALGVVQESGTTRLLAELGVVFLLFDIGLHFTWSTIWDARRDIFGLGPLQIALCGLAFGVLAMAFGMRAEHALILGGALALSSTAVVVHTLAERGQQNCPVGLTGTAVLIFQDVCAIFLLIFAASLEDGAASSAEPAFAASVSMAVLKAAAVFAAALWIGRYGIGPLFRVVAQTKNEEIFTATALLVILATAAATGHAGLSLTLGAFLGGMIISETPYRHVIQTEAKPFRNLLLGFFFITVGMSLDWRVLIAHGVEIFLFLVALVATKAVLVAAAARAFGWSTPGAVQLGFLLAQGSEFVFVIVAMPTVRQTLGEGTVGVLITGVAASLALTPALAAFGNGLARTLRQRYAAADRELVPRTTAKPVVVLGMGDIGRSVADALEAHGIPYDAIEGDHDRFLAASADGYPISFGNYGDVRLMETLAYSDRKAVVLTHGAQGLGEMQKTIMDDRYPTLARFIAVDGDEEKARFEALGMHPIVNGRFPRGLDLAAAVLRHQGLDEEKILAWSQREQNRVLPTMLADAASG